MALSISAYAGFTSRAQVSEGLSLAGDLKALVEEQYAESGTWIPNSAAIGEIGTDRAGKFVSSIAIAGGTLEIVYGNAAAGDIAGQMLTLRPHRNAAGSLIWQCGNADPNPPPPAPAIFVTTDTAGTASGPNATTVPTNALPKTCQA